MATVVNYDEPHASGVLHNVKDLAISWHDITYIVDLKGKKGLTKTILSHVSGVVKSGEMLAVMGPSGCGKTTLLDVIADRIQSGDLTGEVLVNGKERDASFKRISNYVPQEDSLMGILTVRETLGYAADLGVGGKTAAEKRELVESTINALGLGVCADGKIGDLFFKGISGGQKRRLSIAIELLSNPSILILDEPTSGLDSAAALGVMKVLVDLTKAGEVVISTVHQPSSELFHLFDKLCLLAAGHVVYFGKASKVVKYFSSIGHECPKYTNPADFMLSLINTDFSGHVDVPDLVDKYASSRRREKMVEAIKGQPAVGVEDVNAPLYPTTQLAQFWTLSRRNLVNAVRNPGLYWVRLAMYFVLAFMVGTMYWNIKHDHNSVTDRIGMLFYVAAMMIFLSVIVLPFFIEGRHVFLRERANGQFAVLPWVLSNYLTSLPGLFVVALVASATVYFPAGLHSGRFVYFLIDLFFCLLTAESLMRLLSALVNHYIVGIALAAAMFGMFMLAQGFMVLPDNIPDYWLWGYYTAFHTYAFRGFMYNEFHDLRLEGSTVWTSGNQVLEWYDMEDVDMAEDMAALFAWGLLFELGFYVVLEVKHTGKR